MSSNTAKKLRATLKGKNTARGRHASVDIALRSITEDVDDASGLPLARPEKIVTHSDELSDLTASDGGGDCDGKSDTLDSSSQTANDDQEGGIADVDKSVRTRSSNGITKKRFLDDAAIFSDDEEFPVTLTPKKSRLSTNDYMSQCRELSVGISDPDAHHLQDGLAGNEESLSMSPLKLGGSADSRRDIVSGGDPFVVKSGSLLEPITLKISKASASNVAVSVKETTALVEGRLHPDEYNGIANAITESARESAHNSSYSSVPSAATPVTPKQRRTFKDVFPVSKTTPIMSKGPFLHEDGMKFTVQALPDICEVTDLMLQDTFLAGDYPDLPALRSGSLISWNATALTSAVMTLVTFSEWSNQCPNLDFDAACSAVRFTRYKNFINPSRISPLDVNIFYTVHDRKRSLLQCNFKSAICLSPILSRDCHLINATTTGLHNKYISGYLHTQEWERFEGFACMVFDRPTMVAQIYNEAISFMTMGSYKDREPLSASSSKAPKNPGILASSVTNKTKKLLANAPFKSVLEVTDKVTIYDAREHPFNFASDLEDIASILPKFNEEIPSGSFVVVGYTLGHYDKDGRANLATNILFAILLATE